jgi:urease accessory protein UreF
MKSMEALKHDDLDNLRQTDEELTAIRPASAVRRASTLIGKRMLSLYAIAAR